MQKYVDMPPEEFRKYGYQLIDWITDYLKSVGDYPPLAQIKPGDVKNKLPQSPPGKGEGFEEILKDVDDIIMPGMTHWNHPRFMAYFNSTGSGPGILGELLSGAFNINGMLWKSCPSATELEEVVLGWLRDMIGLPQNYWGIIYEGGSASTLHAVAAAKENIKEFPFRMKGMSGHEEFKRLRLYQSDHAHSSVDKAAVTLGIGLEGIRKIPVDENFSMIPGKLQEAIEEDKKNGWFPFCVVATVGTTSSTSIDPVDEIADICEKENLWLHVDAAHAGTAAIVPEFRHIMKGCDRADSFVMNPHKWMFVPIDLSAFYTKKPDVLRNTFSLVAEYLKTGEDNEVINYMDYGITLGRRFRSIKLWFVIRYFGVEGLRSIIREHVRLGQLFAKWIDDHSNFERLAPTPLSTVCFRAVHEKLDSENMLNEFNEKLMDAVNDTGKVFLSHTKLAGKFTIRLVVSSIRTTEDDLNLVWDTIRLKFSELIEQ